MNTRRSAKRKVRGSPRTPGSGTAHHKNMIFRRTAKKSGQDEGPKTDAQKLVDRFKDGGDFGHVAMKKVAAIFDGKEKQSQKELSELVSALMEAVEGEDYNARIRAVDFIVKFFGSKDIENNDKKEILRKADENREIPILTSIVNALKDEEFDIRFYATKAVVEAIKNELIEDDVKDAVRLRLGSATASGSPFIQAAAMEGIEILKESESPEVEEIQEEAVVEEAPVEEIEEESELPAEEIAEGAGEVPEETQEKVEEKNKTHQIPLNHMVLIEDLKKGNESVRVKALFNIQNIARKGDDVSFLIPEIIEMLDDKFTDVRMEAGYALKAMGKQAIPALIEVLNNRNQYARYEAVLTLGYLRDESASQALINIMINDSSDNVREAAIEALGKIEVVNPDTKSIGIIFALVSALKDKKKDVRKSAVEALAEILEHGATEKSGQLIMEALQVASEDKDPEVKRAAAKARNDLGHVI